jgi:predicted lipoprotein with Yx(FWY)xxD motif
LILVSTAAAYACARYRVKHGDHTRAARQRGRLALVTRSVANPDGKGTQVVYNNWPLYYYVKDAKPGDVAGQNLGNKWFVVPPDLAP